MPKPHELEEFEEQEAYSAEAEELEEVLTLDPIKMRLSADLKAAALTMTADEARFLVDAYYIHQENRKREDNQRRSMGDVEPHAVLDLLAANSKKTEALVRSVLNTYVKAHDIGNWMLAQVGIGPVIAAGMLAHLDITKAPTAGHFWSYAGLVDGIKWIGKAGASDIISKLKLKGTITYEQVEKAAEMAGRKIGNVVAAMKGYGDEDKFTAKNLQRALARRPWNATLKTLCWKAGDCFMKNHNRPNCLYGQLYSGRKKLEIERNDAGQNIEVAKRTLETTKIGKSTDTYAWYSGCFPAGFTAELQTIEAVKRQGYITKHKGEPGSGQPMIPPGRIELRAYRYAVQIFLAHLQWVWYEMTYKEPAPKPYVLDRGPFAGEHAHIIKPMFYEPLPR